MISIRLSPYQSLTEMGLGKFFLHIVGCYAEFLLWLRRHLIHCIDHYGLHNRTESACTKFVFHSLVDYGVERSNNRLY